MDAYEFKKKIASIYEIANELGREFNIAKCTPDGHLLGAIGQIAAKIAFGLQFGSGEKEHNCTWSDNGKTLDIQVRSTGRGSVAIRKEPEYLIAIEIAETGRLYLLYNGPGKFVWKKIQHQKQPQKSASKNQLWEAQQDVPLSSQIRVIQNIFES